MRDGPEQHAARRTLVLVVAVGAFLAGAVVVGLLLVAFGARHRVQVAEQRREDAHAALERERAQVRETLAQADARLDQALAGSRVEQPLDQGWFSEALRAFAREGLARGWAEVRDDALPEDLAALGLSRFREEVEALPVRLGRELAEQRDLDDLVEAGIEAAGVFRYLELLDEERFGPFPDLVSDGERFGALFGCGIAGPVVAGDQLGHPDAPSGRFEDGTTVRFPRGVFDFRYSNAIPRCMTIEGAGMDATLLYCQAVYDRERVEQLVIRDCTLKATGVDVLDFRGRGSQVLFERVRVIGFDAGAGSSNALSLDQTAFLARDCRFEGGYGRNPAGSGTLFDVRTSGLLARFERCRFEAMELELRQLRGRATVVFSACSMIDLRDEVDPRTIEHSGIRFENCSVQLADPEAERDWKRDLGELFPGWRERR